MVSVKETELLSSVLLLCVLNMAQIKKNKDTNGPAPVQFLYALMLHILVKNQS